MVSDELQAASPLSTSLVPSEYVPVAVNSLLLPAGMLGSIGVTEIEDSKDVTVRVCLPETNPEVAVMIAVPGATAVAKPLLLIVATDGSDEVQVTRLVIS